MALPPSESLTRGMSSSRRPGALYNASAGPLGSRALCYTHAPAMDPQPPEILVTNDDGIDAAGLHFLARSLASVGRVTINAPNREQSASGHALTLHRPL